MNDVYGKAVALIEEGADESKFGPHGGFTAVLSTPSEDRDFEQLMRKEWIEPLEESYPLDMDHGMSVAQTIGSFTPYFDGDRLMMDAYFARDPESQRVRGLVTPDENGRRHIRSVSVAFMTHKTKKSENEPFRELLNAGVVCIPSNRDAVILASKAAHALKDAFSTTAEGDVPEDVKAAVMGVLSPESGHWCDSTTCHGSDGSDDNDSDVRSTDDFDVKKYEAHLELNADTKANKKPYGDVEYADPGYQSDGQARYPVDSEQHVRAALSYFGKASNRAHYSPEQVAKINAVIHRRAHELGIDTSPDDRGKGIFVNIIPRLDRDALKYVLEEIEISTKAAATASGVGGDGALVQAIHDASSHLGAACPVMEPDVDPDSGASSGANKSVENKIEAFEKALDQVLTPQEEESPAEAAAATDEVPAPAVEAAGESDAVIRARAMQMSLALLTTNYDKE